MEGPTLYCQYHRGELDEAQQEADVSTEAQSEDPVAAGITSTVLEALERFVGNDDKETTDGGEEDGVTEDAVSAPPTGEMSIVEDVAVAETASLDEETKENNPEESADPRDWSVSSNSGSEGDHEGDDELDADAPRGRTRRGNIIRRAAWAALEALSNRQWMGPTEVRRTRAKRSTEELETVEALLNRLVDGKIENNTVYYRADWVEYETEDDRYTWEPVEHLEGHEEWMQLVDLWVEKYREKFPTFAAFSKNNKRAIELGASKEMRCWFYAVSAVMQELKMDKIDVEAIVKELEEQKWSFSSGVMKNEAPLLMATMVKHGVKLDLDVWNINLYDGGKAKTETLLRAMDDPGVYMIATIDAMRGGHVWVILADENWTLTVIDNGEERLFSGMRFSEIISIRKCVVQKPQRVKRRHRSLQTETKKKARTDN